MRCPLDGDCESDGRTRGCLRIIRNAPPDLVPGTPQSRFSCAVFAIRAYTRYPAAIALTTSDSATAASSTYVPGREYILVLALVSVLSDGDAIALATLTACVSSLILSPACGSCIGLSMSGRRLRVATV